MAWKRGLDLALGIPAAMVALPVVAVVAVLVLLTSGWPPFVVQTRVGAYERPIRVAKVRTMRRGTPLVAKSELRPSAGVYTPLGPLLRRSSLDELPQLWSVLKGDMSLVGPRPPVFSQTDLMALRRKHGVQEDRPGITGLAQVLGRESLTLSSKVRCEALYHRERSLGLDLAILGRTLRALVSRRGAY